MNPCESWHDLLLDYVYGLLEPEEEARLRAHLAGCPACQHAQAEAQAQQRLLARAAQVYREVPVFTAPSSESTPQEEHAPATLPLQAGRPKRRMLRWVGAAIAAGLLMAAAGLYARYAEGLDEHLQQVNAERRQVQDLDMKLASATRAFDQDLAGLPGRVRSSFLQLDGTGPTSYQPGAPTQFRVSTRDLDCRRLPATVTVRLADPRRQQTVFECKEIPSDGDLAVTLPAGLPVEPGAAPWLEISARAGGAEEKLKQKLHVEPPEYLLQLALSKSVCEPGEVVYFRTLTLERFRLRPPGRAIPLRFTLRAPQGPIVRELTDPGQAGGIAGGSFVVPPNLSEGEYTLEAAFGGPGRAPFTTQARRLLIRRDQTALVHFDRAQYRPGETVHAQFQARRQANGARVPNQPLTVKATADDRPVNLAGAAPGRPLQTHTDTAGRADIRLKLPPRVASGKAVLEVQVHDGARTEKLVQPIPVGSPGPVVDFFPEGGDLVAGLPARVYFRAQLTTVSAGALQGRVVDAQTKAVVDVRTVRGGSATPGVVSGVFSFVPQAGQSYRLQITAPAGIKATPALPEVRPTGVALAVPDAVAKEGEPIRVAVHATGPERSFLVLATCRGQVVEQQMVDAGPGGSEILLHPVAGTRGVVRVTVYEPRDGRLVPVAERLAFRAPAQQLHLSFADERRQAGSAVHARDEVQLGIRATRETGQPAEGWLLAAVVDERAIVGTDRQSEPGPPAFFLLDSTLPQAEQIDDANFLLRDAPAARQALDLFLATAGWRRFVAAPAEAMLAAGGSGDVPAIFHASNAATLPARLSTALAQQEEHLRQQAQAQRGSLLEERQQHERANLRAAAALADYEQLPRDYLRLTLGILVVVLLAGGAGALLVGLVRAIRGATSPTGSLATAFAALGLCLLLFGLTGSLRVDEGRRDAAQRADLQEPAVSLPGKTSLPADATRVALAKSLPAGELARGRGGETGARDALSGEGRERKTRGSKADALRVDHLVEQAGVLSRRIEREPQPEGRKAKTLEAMRVPAPGGPPAPAAPGAGSAYPASGPRATTGATAKLGDAAKGSPHQGAFFAGRGGAVYLRSYAHRAVTDGPDLADTLLWQPALLLHDGRAQAGFVLSDRITTYQVLLYGHDAAGRLGFAQGTLAVRPAAK
jgi:hypothetical protein